MKEYFVGTDRLTMAYKRNAMISANALVRNEGGKLRYRQDPLVVNRWMMDSGAFSQINLYGDFIMSPEEYIKLACKFQYNGRLACIVTQDYMCEPDVIKKLNETGNQASVRIHQKKTVKRYIELMDLAKKYHLQVPVMPVLQGWEVDDYVDHFYMYRSMLHFEQQRRTFYTSTGIPDHNLWPHAFHHRIADGSPIAVNRPWIGIGSTCKRNTNPEVVSQILDAVIPLLPSNAKIHLFGYKKTGLKNSRIKDRIYSADSFAYDFDDKMKGGLRTSEARVNSSIRFHDSIVHNNVQLQLV